jgi:hypothetical protein
MSFFEMIEIETGEIVGPFAAEDADGALVNFLLSNGYLPNGDEADEVLSRFVLVEHA